MLTRKDLKISMLSWPPFSRWVVVVVVAAVEIVEFVVEGTRVVEEIVEAVLLSSGAEVGPPSCCSRRAEVLAAW